VTDVAAPRSTAPYKGLARYEEADAPYFFGRDADAELVVANVLASRLTLLFGGSGVGKSSLLHAGVAPRLRALGDVVPVLFADWRGDAAEDLAAVLRTACGLDPVPGEPLTAAIEACGERAGADLVVILDQFEEYFVYHPDGENDALSRELPPAVVRADLRATFLIAIREDALARLERFKGRIPGLFDTYLRLDRLSRDAAREAIVAPLERRAALNPDDAVVAEPALVDRILDEVEVGRVAFGSAGVGILDGDSKGERSVELPYLQLVLARLWDEERRDGSPALRLETLQRLGGAERIVRTHLDVALDALGPEEQEVAAAVFRYLVTPSGTKIAHRVDDLAEYAGHSPEAVASVLDRLASGGTRVVRPVGEDAYEIYHDVLAAAVLDWRARYLHARELAAVDRRRRTRWRLAIAALVLAILAGIAAGLTIWRVQADRRDAADREAESQQLELARAAQYAQSVYTGHRDVLESVAFSPDSRRVVSADQHGDVRVWTAATGDELAKLHLGGAVQQADFSPDGSLVVAANGKGDVAIWRWRTGERVASLTEPGLDGASFDPGGRLVALPGDDGSIRLWDWRAGRVVAVLEGDGGVVTAASFDPSGDLLVSASDDGAARVWDWRARRVLAKLPADVNTGTPSGVAFSPDGRYVASGTPYYDRTRGARVWDWRTRKPLWTQLPRGGYDGDATVAFAGDGIVLTGNGKDGDVRVWDWRRNRQLAVIRDGVASAALAVSPNGCLVATGGYDPWVRVWAPPLRGCRR
jgi:hypothetical protein